ncbi:alpha/beta hydrolase [Pedococcus bigeumensis]|uniref:Alpha/beta hydrolase n=1 Tax=Pedococcus bigeumensis TaxID=433644 RepID=A0A502CM77_9MICO|nr:alpha/beta hydrolase [Pedococcus bigeumensis]TPG14008.1 alpha/beta hydrolase [Pedococcus bigeumensis]
MGPHPQAPATEPDSTGTVTRDGVTLDYAVYGGGSTTVLLMPTWTVVHSRFWKAQIGYLARHFRVVTFDGRGNGRSDRPVGAAAYTDEVYAADALAVLDATDTARAVVVGVSWGLTWGLHLAAGHPDRVAGLVGLGGSTNVDIPRTGRDVVEWDGPSTSTEGWAKHNRQYWLEGGYGDFLEFFFGQMFSEPHSTKQIQDAVGWALETTPQAVADASSGMHGFDGIEVTPIEEVCARVSCPVLLVHGTQDAISPAAVSQRIAELTGGSVVLLEGAGHGPSARHPVVVNHLIRDFAERCDGSPAATVAAVRPTWTRSGRRRRRALYLSSPIGLGHARRDLAIADELRKRHPDLEISWLAQHPVTTVLERAGERVHPASAWLANESSHIEHDAGEHDLHAFQAIRRMDEVLVQNFMVFDDVVRGEQYDLVIGDEAWDLDYFLHENPELKRFPFVWMTDFVGWLPMPEGGAAEAALTADYNAEMLEHRARHRWVRDRSIFVGSPGDVVPDSFGPGLPGIREWTEANFDFAGYVTGFDQTEVADRDRLRTDLGYAADAPVCVVTVGGSGVGAPLLRRVLDAVPLARRQVPELRFLVVTGPRIDREVLPRRRGVTVRGMVPDLYQHLAAADLAVVQGGLTTCMELTASRTPFLYVPLRNHFEQNFHVRHRLERYRAGSHLPYEEAADPDGLAAAIVANLGKAVDYRPVEDDGAARAAGLIAELI